MTQALHTHMNNKKKRTGKAKFLACSLSKDGIFPFLNYVLEEKISSVSMKFKVKGIEV
jgi:hypothetical protein